MGQSWCKITNLDCNVLASLESRYVWLWEVEGYAEGACSLRLCKGINLREVGKRGSILGGSNQYSSWKNDVNHLKFAYGFNDGVIPVHLECSTFIVKYPPPNGNCVRLGAGSVYPSRTRILWHEIKHRDINTTHHRTLAPFHRQRHPSEAGIAAGNEHWHRPLTGSKGIRVCNASWGWVALIASNSLWLI